MSCFVAVLSPDSDERTRCDDVTMTSRQDHKKVRCLWQKLCVFEPHCAFTFFLVELFRPFVLTMLVSLCCFV